MATRKKKKATAPAAKRPRGRPKGSKNKRIGRPPKLNDRVIEQISGFMREGNYLETAAALAGVSKSSAYSWMKTANAANDFIDKGFAVSDHEADCIVFLDSIKKAEADSEALALRRINAAGDVAWQAVAWRLERRHPDRWGRRQAIEHSSPADKPVKVQRVEIGNRVIEF